MKLKLGINCGFAINRYVEPEVWTKIVSQELGLKHVQFVADLLNPFLPKDVVSKEVEKIQYYSKLYDISIDSIFTSAFTRVNHLMHPDKEIRRIWFNWFKDLFYIGKQLGVKSGGSHFGILTFDSYNNEQKRKELVTECIKQWQELSFYAKELDYDFLIFEPMSVPREMANTTKETIELMERVNENCGVPMRICLDLGHAPHPDERDPYKWIEKVGEYSPIIHIQQTVMNKSNHWPFTQEFNQQGIIQPDKVIKTLEKTGLKEALLLFEISHREHWDTDFKVIDDLKESVEYWRNFIKE